MATAFMSPIEACVTEMNLGKRRPILQTTPCGDTCEHIASRLRSGATAGVGNIEWCLRMPVGVRYPQNILNDIAEQVELGYTRSPSIEAIEAADIDPNTVPAWWIEVRA